MKPILLISLLLTTAACQADSGNSTRTTDKTKDAKVADIKGTCGAASLQHLIGETRASIEDMTFDAQRVRIIRPGMAITMDHLESRLNILLDENNTVTKVYCG
jgi:hypothetical protein